MALKTKPRPFTFRDYYSLPEHGPRYQLVDGELHMAPAPSRKHQQILTNLFTSLSIHVTSKKLGKIYVAPFDVQLTETSVFQPDISFFSNDRLNYLTDQGAEGPPNLVIEILSPKTAFIDTGIKREIYARTGVTELWIVDPDRETLQVYHLEKNAELPTATLRGNKTLSTPLLKNWELEIPKVFED